MGQQRRSHLPPRLPDTVTSGESRRSDSELRDFMKEKLGSGPMRFGPARQEKSLRRQLRHNQGKLIHPYASLKARWELAHPPEMSSSKYIFTGTQMIRCLKFCKYDEMDAFGLMKKMDPRRFDLTASYLESQLRMQIMFPVPGLRTIQGSNVVYMRPSRYFPYDTPVHTIVDLLVYNMDSFILRQDPQRKRGIAFIANFEEWSIDHNFSNEYWLKFMQTLQGKLYPASVHLLLIVNPPKSFDKVWGVMRPTLSKSFRRCVYRIDEDQLPRFMQEGFEKYLPDDLESGTVSTSKLVDDFIKFQKCFEKETGKISKEVDPAAEHSKRSSSHRRLLSLASPRRSPKSRLSLSPKRASHSSHSRFNLSLSSLPIPPISQESPKTPRKIKSLAKGIQQMRSPGLLRGRRGRRPDKKSAVLTRQDSGKRNLLDGSTHSVTLTNESSSPPETRHRKASMSPLRLPRRLTSLNAPRSAGSIRRPGLFKKIRSINYPELERLDDEEHDTQHYRSEDSNHRSMPHIPSFADHGESTSTSISHRSLRGSRT